MALRYIDAHCHPQFSDYDSDRKEVLARMRAEGVGGVVVGCDLETSRLAVSLAESSDELHASVGLHPNHTDEVFDSDAYRALAESAKVVAVGECGLDYFRSEGREQEQKELLQKHLDLARALDLPLIIHCRPRKGTNDAYQDLIAILAEEKKQNPLLRGDIHFFVGGVAEAEAFVALGFTVSFTAVITFARDYDAVIRALPLSAILAETDSPYVAPVSRRGERNDALAVKDVVAKIAEIRGEDVELVREALLTNTKRVFSLA